MIRAQKDSLSNFLFKEKLDQITRMYTGPGLLLQLFVIVL